MSTYKTFSAQTFSELELSAYTVVDLRDPAALAYGEIEGAINIPAAQLEEKTALIPKDKPVVLFCYVGLASEQAARRLSELGYDAAHLEGGYLAYKKLMEARRADEDEDEEEDEADGGAPPETAPEALPEPLFIDARGLKCPGPIVAVADALKGRPEGTRIRVEATEDAFYSDVQVWCERTGNRLDSISVSDGVIRAEITRASARTPAAPQRTGQSAAAQPERSDKTFVVFSGDLDKTIAAFIMANGAAAMGRKVTMFFTFWGLNVLRRPEKVAAPKRLMERMFCAMMPRGTKKLGLSRMNMGGVGAKLIRRVMKEKGIRSLEELIESARIQGVRLVACQMSMDIMGVRKEELIDGVELGGVATFLGAGEQSDMSLFI